MTCRNCGATVVFGPVGWMHRDSTVACPQIAIAWPPPTEIDDEG